MAPIFLMLRMDIRIAVDFRCRRLKNLRLHPLCKTEHVDGAMNAGLGRLHRVALVVNGRSRTSEIVDLVDLDVQRKCHVVPSQFEMLVIEKMFDIFPAAGEKLSTQKNVAARREKPLAKVRAEKSSPPVTKIRRCKCIQCPEPVCAQLLSRQLSDMK